MTCRSEAECDRFNESVRKLEAERDAAVLRKDEAVAEVSELQSALEDCLALLKAIEEQSGPERMKQFRVDPYGTIADAGARLLLSRRIVSKTERRKDQKGGFMTADGTSGMENW